MGIYGWRPEASRIIWRSASLFVAALSGQPQSFGSIEKLSNALKVFCQPVISRQRKAGRGLIAVRCVTQWRSDKSNL